MSEDHRHLERRSCLRHPPARRAASLHKAERARRAGERVNEPNQRIVAGEGPSCAMAFGSASEERLVEAQAADIRDEINCLPTLGLTGIKGFVKAGLSMSEVSSRDTVDI